jgi:hypothetical protein
MRKCITHILTAAASIELIGATTSNVQWYIDTSITPLAIRHTSEWKFLTQQGGPGKTELTVTGCMQSPETPTALPFADFVVGAYTIVGMTPRDRATSLTLPNSLLRVRR